MLNQFEKQHPTLHLLALRDEGSNIFLSTLQFLKKGKTELWL